MIAYALGRPSPGPLKPAPRRGLARVAWFVPILGGLACGALYLEGNVPGAAIVGSLSYVTLVGLFIRRTRRANPRNPR